VITATFPSGATKITELHLDGRTKSVTGTGGPKRIFCVLHRRYRQRRYPAALLFGSLPGPDHGYLGPAWSSAHDSEAWLEWKQRHPEPGTTTLVVSFTNWFNPASPTRSTAMTLWVDSIARDLIWMLTVRSTWLPLTASPRVPGNLYFWWVVAARHHQYLRHHRFRDSHANQQSGDSAQQFTRQPTHSH